MAKKRKRIISIISIISMILMFLFMALFFPPSYNVSAATPTIITAVPNISMPGSVSANQSITANWNSISGASSYLVALLDQTTGTKPINNIGITQTSYTINASTLTAGHSYKFWVGVTNAAGTNAGSAAYFTVSNALPTPSVSITSPSSGAQFTVGNTVTIKGAGTNCHHIALFIDGASVGGATQNGNSYSYNYIPKTAGTHTIQLKANNAAEGAAGSTVIPSQTVSITVMKALAIPTVSITRPSSGAQFTVGNTVTIKGTGTNCHHIALFIDGVSVGGATQKGNSYSYNYIPTTAGTHIIQLKSRIVTMSFCEPRSWTRVLSS